MQLVVLAAGMGSRFGGLKQMEPMDDAGNFLLDYSAYDAKRAGFDSVVFIIKKDFYEDFKNTIGKRLEKIIKVDYAFQDLSDLPNGFTCPKDRVKPWGTAHAIYAARDLIKDDFIIINGDDFYGKETYEIAFNFLKNYKGKDYANVTFEAINTITKNGSVKRGVAFKDNNGTLTKLVECKISDVNGTLECEPLEGGDKFNIEPTQDVSMNLFIFRKNLIDHLISKFPLWLEKNVQNITAEFLIPSVVDELIHENKVEVKILKTPSVWFGVTYKEDKPAVVNALKELTKKGIYKEGLY